MPIVRFIVLTVVVFAFSLDCGQREESIHWVSSLQEALSRAGGADQHILVEVQTKTCNWCRTLEDSTLSDSTVIDFSKDFVWVKLDANVDTTQVRSLHVFGYPTVLLLNPSGQEVDRIVGYRPPREFMDLVRNYLDGRGTMGSLLKQVTQDSSDVELLYQLGRKYWERGLWEQNLALFERVVKLDPLNQQGYSDDAIYGQGETLRRLEKTDQAVACFQEITRRFPDSDLVADAELEVGYTYQQAEQAEQALQAYREFLRRHPEHQYADWVDKQLEKLSGTSSE